jgi:hypothetical protein
LPKATYKVSSETSETGWYPWTIHEATRSCGGIQTSSRGDSCLGHVSLNPSFFYSRLCVSGQVTNGNNGGYVRQFESSYQPSLVSFRTISSKDYTIYLFRHGSADFRAFNQLVRNAGRRGEAGDRRQQSDLLIQRSTGIVGFRTWSGVLTGPAPRRRSARLVAGSQLV